MKLKAVTFTGRLISCRVNVIVTSPSPLGPDTSADVFRLDVTVMSSPLESFTSRL